MRNFSYYVNAFRIVDGDTIQATLDLGFHLSGDWSVRLFGVDAPEIHGPTRKYGLLVSEVVDKWMRNAQKDGEIRIQSMSIDEKYGRLLGLVFNSHGESLTEYLLINKLVLAYDGGTKQQWTQPLLDQVSLAVNQPAKI